MSPFLAGPILAGELVSKHYGSIDAVDRFSFTAHAGEVLGIGGPNGAGKTTLFDVITGLSPATAGRVLLDSADITRLGPDRICQRGVARTFQLNAVFDAMTGRENEEVASYFGHAPRALPGLRLGRATRERARAALSFVGLLEKSERPVAGMPVLDRKLMMIAGALATEPRVILLDEPVGGLTPQEIDRISDVVRRLVDQGVTIVLIEHVMRFLLALSTRVIIMNAGSKLFEGPPHLVAEDDGVRRTYLGVGATARLKQHFATSDG